MNILLNFSDGLICFFSRITWGKFANCGQTCIAPDYILCEPGIQDRVVEEIQRTLLVSFHHSRGDFDVFVSEVFSRHYILYIPMYLQEFYGEDPKSSPDYGRIINQHHFDRVIALLEGSTVTVGGKNNREECYIGKEDELTC